MGNRKKTSLSLAIGSILLVLIVLGWFILSVFEGENPQIALQPFPEYLSETQKFTLTINDMKRGLKNLEVSLSQEGRKISILKTSFPFKGLFNREGTRKYDTEFSVDPSQLNLAQGSVDMYVRVWDYSRRNSGDGNISTVLHKMIVDTIPPALRAVSRTHYVNIGGTGFVVYQTSLDSVESGIFVGDCFFKGYPADEESQEGYHVCYFTISPDNKPNPEIYLWAEDGAGNRSRANLYCHIRRKRFRTEKINVSDRFLQTVLPYFSFYSFSPGASDVEKFLQINQKLRKENDQTFYNLRTNTNATQLWKAGWLRLQDAAPKAEFGDRRLYYYDEKQIDTQVHYGVDLASLANSKVQAANNGQVIFAERLGIYGNTVVLDHGQGLASAYSHLSNMSVGAGQEVMKGDEIGLTGQTGLAAGDHLHFAILVNGEFVNPIEWWDSHWIEDNISKKMGLLKK